MEWAIFQLSVVLLAYAAVSGRLHGTAITPAIVFTGVGYLVGTEGFDLIGAELDASTVRLLAEVTLALVLFGDASALHVGLLRREAGIPIRLLGVGLPLIIVFGGVLALVMFPRLNLFEAFVLAVLLAPTDAALGQTVVSDERLPSRLRQGLSVESGFNDGVCVPLLFAAVAFAELEEAPAFDGQIMGDLELEACRLARASLGPGRTAGDRSHRLYRDRRTRRQRVHRRLRWRACVSAVPRPVNGP